jgi:hypothetical protein
MATTKLLQFGLIKVAKLHDDVIYFSEVLSAHNSIRVILIVMQEL